jgi:hypothetical protein
VTDGQETPTEAPGIEADPGATEPRRRPWKRRTARRVLAVLVAAVAALVVSILSIDLSLLYPGLIRLAEREGSKYLERPLHIGDIDAFLTPGHFRLANVVIDGKNPGDRPFFSAERIDVRVNWLTLLRKEIHVNVTIDAWRMVVETWSGGVHNLPKLAPRGSGGGKLPFTTTVDFAYARGGHFVFEDHGTPWSVDAPNLSFSLVRSRAQNAYVGLADFDGGTTRIQSYLPMATSFSTRFVLDGSKVRLQHIDLVTDGSRSHVNGDVDFKTWPNQIYHVTSDVDFPRMKELFFARETWRLNGSGRFTGTFRLFKDGRDLSGEFTSEDAQVDDLEFRNLHGTLQWTQSLFAVTHAETDLFGGHARFDYSIAPLGSPTGSMATFSTDYTDLDLFDLDRLMSLRGLKLAGLASGDLFLQWPNGKFRTGRTGGGRTRVAPPAGVELAPPTLPAQPRVAAFEPASFDPTRRISPLLIGANTTYAIDPAGVTFEESWAATTHSFVRFDGRLADESSRFPFHVTSHDWQESDRLLASIITAVSSPTNAVQVGGRGTFDGVMTGSFSAPKIEGAFTGESMKVWDVVWGRAKANLVIENGYVDITNALVGEAPERSIVPDGRFALGYRRDDQDEILAKVKVTGWPMADLRHAFGLDDWAMDGTIALADLDLRGKYREMFGTGRLRIAPGVAWDERFEEATGDLVLEGTGLRINRIEMRKGTGRVLGTARVGWDGTYDFDADGEAFDVETLDNFTIEAAPLTGRLRFSVSGAGEFARPTYSFEGLIQDLFVGSEGIGVVTGGFTITDKTMTIDRLAVASSRLQALATGTIVFDDAYTSDVRIGFSETALHPYMKFFMADDISPYTRVVVGGSLAVRGPLRTPRALAVEATIDDATLTLFDYELRNDGPVLLTLGSGRLGVAALRLAGTGTNLALTGGGDLEARTWNLSALGDSSLAILGLFPQFAGITASGTARLNASLSGGFDSPRLAGDAVVTDGRIRPLNSPHGLEAVNGRIEFGVTPGGANTIDMRGVTGRIGDGDVTFGGNILLDGYELSEYNLTATGRSMRLRYPERFRSTVDMDLQLVGTREVPRLIGTISVLRVAMIGSVDPGAGIFGFAGATGATAPESPAAPAEGTELALDIKVTAPRMRFIDTNAARLDGSADLDVRGTFNVPVITGRIDVLGGEVNFVGNRYNVLDGVIEFRPDSPEAYFDVSAESRVRVEGQPFNVTVGLSGTTSRLTPTLNSDPWLPTTDLMSIVFGGVPSVGTAERRALQSSEELQQQMLQTVGAYLLTSPLTSRVGSVVEQTGLVDTVQIVPVLSSGSNFQQQNPSARITLGTRISPRVYLTYSRTVGDREEEIILLEYDQNDRLSWVLSRNEDQTFALDFRIRYVF